MKAVEAAQLVAQQDAAAVFDYLRGKAKSKKKTKSQQRNAEIVRTSPLKSPGKKTVVKWGRKISMPLMASKKELELQESLNFDPIDLAQATEAASKVLEKKTKKVSTKSLDAATKPKATKKRQKSLKQDAKLKPATKAADLTSATTDKTVKKRRKSIKKQQEKQDVDTSASISIATGTTEQETDKTTTKRRKSVNKQAAAAAAAAATIDSQESLQQETTKTVTKRRKSIKSKTQDATSKTCNDSADEKSKTKSVTKRRKSVKVSDGQEDATKDKAKAKTVTKRRKSVKAQETKAQEKPSQNLEEPRSPTERSVTPKRDTKDAKKELDRQEAAKAKETAKKLSEGLKKKTTSSKKKKKSKKASAPSSPLRRNPFFKRDESLRSLADSPEGRVMKRQTSFEVRGNESNLAFMLQKHDSFHHSSDLSTKQTQDISESSRDEDILEETTPNRRTPRRIISGFFPRLRKKTVEKKCCLDM